MFEACWKFSSRCICHSLGLFTRLRSGDAKVSFVRSYDSWPFDLGDIVYGECCCSSSRTGAGNGETYPRGLCCKVKSDAGAQADGICKFLDDPSDAIKYAKQLILQ